jgi:hypothetical protein
VKEKTLLALMFGLLTGMILAQSGNLLAQASPSATCQESKTVWRDVSRFGRKRSAAQNMTEKHDEFTKDGWRFADMETYTENSDLEGFFLTYSRDIACGQAKS